jgi:hypothetical protein
VFRKKGKSEGVDFLPIQKKKIRLALQKMKKKEYESEVAKGVKHCLEVFRTRML